MTEHNTNNHSTQQPTLLKKKGELIINVLDETDRIFFLKSGRVKRQIDGKLYHVGKFLELNSFFAGHNYYCNLIAATEVELVVYSRNDFLIFIGISQNSKLQELFSLLAMEQMKKLEYAFMQAS